VVTVQFVRADDAALGRPGAGRVLGVLSSVSHPKIAIAVDEDVNIYDREDILGDLDAPEPEHDVIVIPHERIHRSTFQRRTWTARKSR